MQTNYYFLRQLSNQLAQEVVGLHLAECFSQEKDELVMGFCAEGQQLLQPREFYMKAVLHPDFACLHFPTDFKRAGRNSVGLFKELIDLKVVSIRQFENERAFALYFEQDYILLFKMYGNRSNIILFQENEVLDLFHNKLVVDNNIDLSTLDRPLDQCFEAFEAADGDMYALFPTFGKEISKYLKSQECIGDDLKTKWTRITAVLSQLENPSHYVIKTLNFQPVLSLIATSDEVVQQMTTPMEASNALYYASMKINVFDKEAATVVKTLQKQQQRTQTYIDKCYQQLGGLEDEVKHDEIANIIMANLHAIPARSEVVELYDFYRDRPLKIRLKSDYTPQRNAENYYRKSKNEKIEIQKLMENIAVKEEFLADISQHIQAIESVATLKELRKYLKANLLEPSQKEVLTVQDLFKCVVYQGWEILIGKNARNNDLLTQRYARKEDLWLHARDVSGSHVIIRRQAGKKYPVPVIEKAAGLAAYHSKRRTDTLCPVIVTPKKYVRKTRDLLEGQVIIDKEQVIMIEPSL